MLGCLKYLSTAGEVAAAVVVILLGSFWHNSDTQNSGYQVKQWARRRSLEPMLVLSALWDKIICQSKAKYSLNLNLPTQNYNRQIGKAKREKEKRK